MLLWAGGGGTACLWVFPLPTAFGVLTLRVACLGFLFWAAVAVLLVGSLAAVLPCVR